MEATMKKFGKLIGIAAVAATLAIVAGSAQASAVTEATGSSELITKLQITEQADRLNANSYTSENPTLDHFYDEKADEVTTVIQRLRAGDRVSQKDIDRALDNSEAQSL
jgi:hypothetical protein